MQPNPDPKPCAIDTKTKEELFEFLAHGDEKHRAWLLKAINAFFAGEPRPEVE